MKKYKVVIIGAGPAGLSCGIELEKWGIDNVLLIERREYNGGMLRQCIHDGFGLINLGKSYTGPEFFLSLQKKLDNTRVKIENQAYVLSIDYSKKPYIIKYISEKRGIVECSAENIVIATGCREKPFSALSVPGTRPAGIFSAGSAQYMMNIKNILPGKSAVILGLGDIGLIMARRLMLEGVKVKMVLGLKMTGLKRNLKNCIEDFSIPYREGWSIVSVHGRKRLKGVSIAAVSSDGEIDLSTKEYIPCDTLLTATGLIPEKDLCPLEETEDVYLCGNVKRIYSLVDQVCDAGAYTAIKIARKYLNNSKELNEAKKILKEKIDRSFEELEKSREDESFICTVCPNGCSLSISKIDDEILIKGNKCMRAYEYALSEMKEPKRIITSTVKLKDNPFMLYPVKTSKPVKKTLIEGIMKEIRKIKLPNKVEDGYIVSKNILGSGADLIATNIFMGRKDEVHEC